MNNSSLGVISVVSLFVMYSLIDMDTRYFATESDKYSLAKKIKKNVFTMQSFAKDTVGLSFWSSYISKKRSILFRGGLKNFSSSDKQEIISMSDIRNGNFLGTFIFNYDNLKAIYQQYIRKVFGQFKIIRREIKIFFWFPVTVSICRFSIYLKMRKSRLVSIFTFVFENLN